MDGESESSREFSGIATETDRRSPIASTFANFNDFRLSFGSRARSFARKVKAPMKTDAYNQVGRGRAT